MTCPYSGREKVEPQSHILPVSQRVSRMTAVLHHARCGPADDKRTRVYVPGTRGSKVETLLCIKSSTRRTKRSRYICVSSKFYLTRGNDTLRAGSVLHRSHPGKHVLLVDHAGWMPRTREDELDHTDHTGIVACCVGVYQASSRANPGGSWVEPMCLWQKEPKANSSPASDQPQITRYVEKPQFILAQINHR